jgi:hypothetical protein
VVPCLQHLMPQQDNMEPYYQHPITSASTMFSYNTIQQQGYEELTYVYPGSSSVIWTSLGPLPRWVPRLTTRWAPGTTRLGSHGT